ncbi:hypothetical protein [Streptomyces sp. NPDC051636]
MTPALAHLTTPDGTRIAYRDHTPPAPRSSSCTAWRATWPSGTT